MPDRQDAIEYFLNEHEMMNSKLAELEASMRLSRERRDKDDLLKALRGLLEMKQEFKRHFKEEEKALFPPFESYITNEGGAFMIMEHPSLISAFNELSNMAAEGISPEDLYNGGLTLISILKDHAGRENTILSKLDSLSAKPLEEKVLKELEALRARG
ncbi:MAG: hemerythrin domain-containing protein [Nitrososphaerales archaeon]|nr:hemerythrin domain-containing protein [Nitrososphaerales archaeon]